jgi:hypothetical protein
MHNGHTWELPFEQPARLELQAEWGELTLLPVESGHTARLELSRESLEATSVYVERVGDVVRVALQPLHSFKWFGGAECRARLHVPRDIRASLQNNAGTVNVRGLDGCELGIKSNAGKIDLVNVFGLMHLSADAGSVTGRELGGLFDVETQAGSIRLEILELLPGEHRIRATMGSVRLDLAKGMDVCIETRSALGSVRNQYPVRTEAPARLVLSTDMGSIRVDESSTRVERRQTPSASSAPPRRAANGAPEAPKAVPGDPELERILKMVEAGELSARDADELLRAMGRV